MTMSHQLTIQLAHFEGPLGLLLYLIRKEEMDIMDIKIHEITAQYLDYIKLMKELDIEVAGEFIAMAATLIHIKSRMLLPQYGENGEIVETEDPRKELVQKLLEYQKYQEAAKLLADRPWVGRDVFVRGSRERLEARDEGIELEENALFGLIGAFRRVLKTAKKRVHKVTAKTQSIASRILEMRDRLVVGVRLTLAELVTTAEDRARQTLITFLSLLELGKMGFVGLAQTEPYSDIWVSVRKPIEDAALSRVEEYDNLNSAEIADQLTAKAEPPAGASAEDFVLSDAEDTPIETAAPASEMTDAAWADLSAGILADVDVLAGDEEIVAAEAELVVDADGEMNEEPNEGTSTT